MTAMMTRVAAVLLAVASITFTSCKKDKSGPGNTPVEQKKLTRIEENGQTTATFTYNADGSLETLLTDFSPFGSTTFNFTYANKKIAEVNSTDGIRISYVYENGSLRMTESFEDNKKIAENHFEYENGKMKSNTEFSPEEQGGGNVIYRPTFKTVYTYNANGTVQKISTYILGNNNQLKLDHEYVYDQYDSKNNPLWIISEFSQTFMYQPVPPNNPLSEKYISATGTVEETTQNEYTYDNAGYPVTLKATVTAGGTPTVRTAKFFYQ